MRGKSSGCQGQGGEGNASEPLEGGKSTRKAIGGYWGDGESGSSYLNCKDLVGLGAVGKKGACRQDIGEGGGALKWGFGADGRGVFTRRTVVAITGGDKKNSTRNIRTRADNSGAIHRRVRGCASACSPWGGARGRKGEYCPFHPEY